jgi:hypothetical protein
MFRNKGLVVGVLVGALFLFAPIIVHAEAGYCFCGTDLANVKPDETSKITEGSCFVAVSSDECLARGASTDVFKGSCFFYPESSAADRGERACNDQITKWQADKSVTTGAAESFTSSFRGVTSKLIPECLLKNELSKECRDVSIFVYFLIQLARYLFSIIGALALIMFVYGGFTLILSGGSSEKVKKGTEIVVAAVIGLVIMFGAYMLVSFLGEAVNIQGQFKLK